MIVSPGGRGFQRGHAPGPGPGRASTRTGGFPSSTATRPTRRRTTRARGRRSGGTAPRSPISWPAWARRGRSSGWAASSRNATRLSRYGLSSPRPGRPSRVSKSLDEGFVPPVFTDNDGYSLLDRSRVVGPRESIEWARRLAEAGVFAGLSTGAAMAGVARCACGDRRGDDRDGFPRRRMEVPVHGRLDRRPRRRRRARPPRAVLLRPPHPKGASAPGRGPRRAAAMPATIGSPGSGRPAHRDVRQRFRWADRGPGLDRPACPARTSFTSATRHVTPTGRGASTRCGASPRRSPASWSKKHAVKLVVVACNTATAAALDGLRYQFDVPLVGVIDPACGRCCRSPRRAGSGSSAPSARSVQAPTSEQSTDAVRSPPPAVRWP